MSDVTIGTIRLDDIEHWNAQISAVDALQVDVTTLLTKAANTDKHSDAQRELLLASELLNAVRMAWDMTEIQPGEVAAMTVEPVDDAERIELRLRINQAIDTTQDVIRKARQTLEM